MLRGPLLRNGRKLARNIGVNAQRTQSSSSSSGGSGGGSLLKVTLGLGAAASAGALGYAKMEPSFAKQLKESAPFLEPVLEMIGAETGSPPTNAPPVTTPKPQSDSLLKKSKAIEPPPKAVAPPSPEKPEKTVKTEDPKKDLELRKQKANFNLEQTLRDSTAAAEKSSVEAAEILGTAKSATESYASKLMKAVEEATGAEDHFMWKDANDAKSKFFDSKAKADSKLNEAKKSIAKLEDAIKKGKEDGSTKDNMNLHQAEQTVRKLKEKVESAEAATFRALDKVNFAKQFGASFEESKRNLMEEVNALLPPGKTLQDSKKLNTDDLNLLVHHAHTKIQTLQRELSRIHLSDDDKSREFRQRLAALDKEMVKQKTELNKLVEEKLAVEREGFESELQNQLRRQVGVHTEHLKEALEEQSIDLNRRRQIEVEKAREEERNLQVVRLSEAVQLLQKMEAFLQARQLLDQASKKAKSLWLSCASLNHVLQQGRTPKIDTPQPLAQDIVPLKEASESSEFVKTILDTIPDEALKRGVYPEMAIKERYYKVETACRRVALMDDQNGGGPGRYFLSYLMSLFMMYPKPVPQEELDKEQKVNPQMWDTYDVLSRVRASLQKEDLEQALRYANQLRGEPRNIASDWIKDLRLLLETKQATSALMAYAAATVAQDLPHKAS